MISHVEMNSQITFKLLKSNIETKSQDIDSKHRRQGKYTETTTASTWSVPNWPPASERDEVNTESTISSSYSTTTTPITPKCDLEAIVEWKVISFTFIGLVIILAVVLSFLLLTMPSKQTHETLYESSTVSGSEFSLPRPAVLRLK